MNKEMLARLPLLGFVLYLGIPNTTAFSQETDCNYGPFKHQFRVNLDKITQARINAGVTVAINTWLIKLIIYGGADPETEVVLP